jgi:hypothetical protein
VRLPRAPEGARSPEVLRLTLTSDGGPDLTTVTAVAMVIRGLDGFSRDLTGGSWVASSATAGTWTRAWASDGSDLPASGVYEGFPRITTPSGVYSCEPVRFEVYEFARVA